ncbi:hypothetical protein TNCV_2616371 [Trichonephila clavipes]|nr:hypothetical protein TNCV_2616371 [Trichonephila clavipes]
MEIIVWNRLFTKNSGDSGRNGYHRFKRERQTNWKTAFPFLEIPLKGALDDHPLPQELPNCFPNGRYYRCK